MGPQSQGNSQGTPAKGEVSCQQCSGPMKKTTRTEKSTGLQLLGVIVFLVGLGLLLAFPVGTMVGIVFIIGAVKMGYKKIKIWKCTNCSYFFDRA